MGEDAISPLDPRFALIDALDALDVFWGIAPRARTSFEYEIALDHLGDAVDALLWYREYQKLVGEGMTSESARREADRLWRRRVRTAKRRHKTDSSR